MIPEFSREGKLPVGIHWATWHDVDRQLGFSERRRRLLGGLKTALRVLRSAGCRKVYIDGSFVTVKEEPGDYDACWDIEGVHVESLEAVFLDLTRSRRAQKEKYLGEFFPAQMPEGVSGNCFWSSSKLTKRLASQKAS